jgi:hypothetical protein
MSFNGTYLRVIALDLFRQFTTAVKGPLSTAAVTTEPICVIHISSSGSYIYLLAVAVSHITRQSAH